MADVPTISHDENKPAGTRGINLGDNDIREFKTQVREILAQDHKIESSGQGATWGFHNFLTLLVQLTLSALADAFRLGSKDVAGKAELHGVDEDGNVIVFTSKGYILLDSARQTNNAYIKALDAAGTGTVDLIKADAADVPVVGAGAQTPTDSAPTVDKQIPNKKYVDDAIAAAIAAYAVPNIFGARVSRNADQEYAAATDGVVEVVLSGSTNKASGYTDSSSPPATLVGGSVSGTSGTHGFSFRVLKGENWKVVTDAGSVVSITWMPVGS